MRICTGATSFRITTFAFFFSVQIRKTQVQVPARTGNDRRIVWICCTAVAVDRRAFKVGPRASGASRERTAVRTVRNACTTRGSRGIRCSCNIRRISRRITVDCCVILHRRARRRVASTIICRRVLARRPQVAR